MFLSREGIYEGILQAGLRLAETPESEGGWSEYFCETDEADLSIEDPMLRAQTALLLENSKRWLATKCGKRLDEQGRLQIDEATRSAVVGGFSDYLFPIIRAGFPTNPINDLVSVQPTTRRTASIVYFNWVAGTTKGSVTEGQRIFDANAGHQMGGNSYSYSGEFIDTESITLAITTAAASGAAEVSNFTLVYADGGGVRPGTVNISATYNSAAVSIVDDGQGALYSADITGTINYKTGYCVLTAGTNNKAITAVTAAYRWDSEGSSLVPEMDVQIVTSTVETERRSLRVNYSIEAMQDIMSEFGVSLEPNLVSGAAEQMNNDVARQVIAEMWDAAPADVATFNTKPSAGLTRADHFQDIVYTLNTASNNIESRTSKGYGNWLVADEYACNVIESMPSSLFVASPRPASVMGVHFIGTLAGKYKVYKDVKLKDLPGATGTRELSGGGGANDVQLGAILMGFKGSQFFEAGFVWSPYNLLYTTPSLTRSNFMTEKGLASRYATKLVNPDMYARIALYEE